ncbi:MAG: DoxX family membrane protein [Chloroflexota bacterium]
MIKTILLIVLGLFFVLNGINHLFNTKTLAEYAHKRELFTFGIFSPELMVQISGIALIFGGLSLMTGILKIYGIIGLCLFLLVASFTIHSFWTEEDNEVRMLEAMNFAKNIAILTELAYIATA